MLGSLVQTTTTDGVRLDGFLHLPDGCNEVWILVHGVNSNFYSSRLLVDLANLLIDDAQGVLLVNTRGHDILSFNTGPSPMQVGSQVESLSSSLLDLQAWYEFLLAKGVNFISLLGHSLGALKCCLWVHQSSHNIKRWIAISPPRLNTELLISDPEKGSIFRGHLRDAAELCASGNPNHVMKVRFPMPMWICASAYCDKYGSGQKHDYVVVAPSIQIPSLWVFGQLEVESGSSNFNNANVVLSDAIEASHPSPPAQIRVIAGGDHSYHDARPELFRCIRDWMS